MNLNQTFIEIKNPKKANIVIRRFYKHPRMNLNEFGEFFLNNYLDKLSEENNTVFLFGDFTINILNYDKHNSTNEFLDSMSSHLFLIHTLQTTRVKSNSKILIDYKF